MGSLESEACTPCVLESEEACNVCVYALFWLLEMLW